MVHNEVQILTIHHNTASESQAACRAYDFIPLHFLSPVRNIAAGRNRRFILICLKHRNLTRIAHTQWVENEVVGCVATGRRCPQFWMYGLLYSATCMRYGLQCCSWMRRRVSRDEEQHTEYSTYDAQDRHKKISSISNIMPQFFGYIIRPMRPAFSMAHVHYLCNCTAPSSVLHWRSRIGTVSAYTARPSCSHFYVIGL